MKVCSKCRVPKVDTEFYRCKSSKDGRHCYCKSCNSETVKKWNEENQERRTKRSAFWKKANRKKTRGYDKKAYWSDPEKSRADDRKKTRENPERRRKSKLFSKFGITLDEFAKMEAAQNGVCAICKKKESRAGKKNLSVDHDHATGKVRGLLCNACNVALGLFKDSPSSTQAATEYLLKIR